MNFINRSKKQALTLGNTLKINLMCLSVLILLSNCKTEKDQNVTQKPNIILILADDFGVGDIQAHYPENKIPTPNLDNLANEGMSFLDAHSSSAVCSPTRYGLLTGRYNWRTPLQEWVLACYEPPLIKKERTTLPEILKQNGYATACIGKWHLGWHWEGEHESERIERKNELRKYNWDFTKPIKGGPTEHGFDYYFGTHVPNFPPFTFIENDRILVQPTSLYKKEDFEGEFMPQVFDNMPMAPGWKFENILPELTNRAVKYIHEQSKKTEPFFLYFSMTSPHEPVSPSDNFKGKSGIAPIADFVMETDWSVGELLNAIKKAGISENTLIIFTADNGHSHYTGWNDLVNAGHMPSGPYRGHKGDIWEGGHRVPFIAKWPKKIQPASSSNQLLCLTDVYATVHDLIKNEPTPANEGEDSFSILPVLLGQESKSKRENLVSHSVDGEFAFRNNEGWKIVYRLPEEKLDLSRGKPAKVELYNLKEDIHEAQNVLEDYPEVAESLKKELEAIVDRGTSRTVAKQANDVEVKFDIIQKTRWAEE
ncbi:sulfatase family protein [Flexithrix dorotheae]|uniref:sulfatase family protein n=1 Tax=Flexithrix dorotheae TaxID=70993 RepID=UPI0007C5C73E|nr:arylsulfatase [Flexithrix dorotheae]